MGGPARGAGVPGCAPDGVLIAHVHGTHVLCDCWMPSYPADSGRIATSTAAHCTGPRQTLPRAEFEPSAPLFRFVHRRRAPPSTDAACPSIDQRDVTRDLLHPRSSSALSDRDHTRARAPRLLCSLVLHVHLSPSARSACASAWPHPGRGKGPLRWARVALSVSGCLPPGRFGLLPLWGGDWGARGRKNNRRAGQVMDTPHAALPSARGVDGPGGPHLGHRTALGERKKAKTHGLQVGSPRRGDTPARAKREGWEDQDGTPPPHKDLNRTALHRRSAS